MPRHRIAEAPFQQVVEGAPNAMVMVDRDGRIVLVNEAAERIFGYTRRELLGRSVDTLLPRGVRGAHTEHRARFYGSPTPRPMGAGRNLHGLRKDGVEVPIEIGLNPIETADGLFVLASIVDITERLRSEERIKAALEEKTVLLHEVHHRVKNNLQIVAGLLRLQAHRTPDPTLRAVLEGSVNRVTTMALIHQLLYESDDFARVALGQHLRRLADMILHTHREDGARIALRTDLEDVHLDLDRSIPCGLLVNELLTNAFRHAFENGQAGEVHLRLRQNPTRTVVIEVQDTGRGLPADIRPDTARSLGLKLAFQLASQLDGTLTLHRGRGTRAELRFPLRREAGVE
jgi:PAS domain S-box-containing protein